MSLPDASSVTPGLRPLLPLSLGADLPPDVLDLVLELGQACNEAGLALLDARTQLTHASEALFRVDGRADRSVDALGWVARERFSACVAHAERLTALYAGASARYAVCAVEIASRVADGCPPPMPTSLPVLPSDVLTLAQLHVPLLQIPEHAVASAQWRRRLPVENAGLADDHRILQAAIAAVRSPPATYDDPDRTGGKDRPSILETEFPAALHAYASGCAYALAIMCVKD